MMREAWSEAKRDEVGYGELFVSEEEEREWGLSALKLLDNYLEIENPKKLPSEPAKREMWVRGTLKYSETESFLVRGIVDRLDLVREGPDVVLCVTDYKVSQQRASK